MSFCTVTREWPGDRHQAGIDIGRLDDAGRIIEHWDVLQVVPDRSANIQHDVVTRDHHYRHPTTAAVVGPCRAERESPSACAGWRDGSPPTSGAAGCRIGREAHRGTIGRSCTCTLRGAVRHWPRSRSRPSLLSSRHHCHRVLLCTLCCHGRLYTCPRSRVAGGRRLPCCCSNRLQVVTLGGGGRTSGTWPVRSHPCRHHSQSWCATLVAGILSHVRRYGSTVLGVVTHEWARSCCAGSPLKSGCCFPESPVTRTSRFRS